MSLLKEGTPCCCRASFHARHCSSPVIQCNWALHIQVNFLGLQYTTGYRRHYITCKAGKITKLHIFLQHWKKLSGSIIPHNSGLQMLGPNTIAHTCNPKIKPRLPVTEICVSKVFVEFKKEKRCKTG